MVSNTAFLVGRGFLKLIRSNWQPCKRRYGIGKRKCKREMLKVKAKRSLKKLEDEHDILKPMQESIVFRHNEVKSDDRVIETPNIPLAVANVLPPCSTTKLELETRAVQSVREGEAEKVKTLELILEGNQPVRNGLKKEAAMATELAGISFALAHNKKGSGVIFVLERASLTLAFVGRKYQILNPNEHADYMRKKNLNPYDFRPDILHEALLQIMDSRLCLAGRLKAIYVNTDQGILIKIEPNTKIPRTLESFCNMMAELMQKLSIKAKGKHGKLLRLVENPVTKHLPANSQKIGLSFNSEKATDIREYTEGISDDCDIVFVVGAMAHGRIDSDYVDDLVSVIGCPLSAAVCLRHITIALERKWRIR